MKTVKGFYFANEDRRLRYGDGREIVVGETHEVDGPIKLCERGLHASKRLIDALRHAPGPILYRVELSGEIKHRGDKMVATHRRYLAEFDAGDVLLRFACNEVLLHIGLIRHHFSEREYATIERYLKTGDKAMARMAGQIFTKVVVWTDIERMVVELARMASRMAFAVFEGCSSVVYYLICKSAFLQERRLEDPFLGDKKCAELTGKIMAAAGWDI